MSSSRKCPLNMEDIFFYERLSLADFSSILWLNTINVVLSAVHMRVTIEITWLACGP